MIGAAALVVVAAGALLLLAWPGRERRAWALAAFAGATLYFALRGLPMLIPGPRSLGVYWNWSGHLLALAGTLVLAATLARRIGLGARAFGFARPVALGTAAAVTALVLALNAVLNAASGSRLGHLPVETWLFMASMPGLAEEVAFRGVLLAAAERAAPATRVVAGVALGPGALLLTLAFVALHGANPGTLVSVLPATMLYLWLRLKTGSVWVPIVAHNLWNLTVLAAHS